MITSSYNAFPDDQAATVESEDDDLSPAEVFEAYLAGGPNPEYVAFETRNNYGNYGSYRRTSGANIWEFIDDAVDGTGGFANGQYLWPFKLEISDGGAATLKFLLRQKQADYDNFVGHICNAPWDVIVGASDMVRRVTTNGTQAEALLPDFWENCDLRGTAIFDFLEFPHKQARRFGTGIIVMDRPAAENETQKDNFDSANRPYIYAVQTRNVRHWEWDDDGGLAGIVIIEPNMIDAGDGKGRQSIEDVRVWTRQDWALFRPGAQADVKQDGTQGTLDGKVGTMYSIIDFGTHGLGEVPVVPCFNEAPPPRRLLANTEMFDVARSAQTVYNIDSEARDAQRKCAVILAIPVKAADTYVDKSIVISNEVALLYDGDAGKPEWISPDLKILDHLNTSRETDKLGSYQMAGLGALAAITEAVKTASGYHAEVEFAKTERRIASHAKMLELVEKRLARLYLKYFGIESDDDDLFSVTYPKDFGVRDMDALINQTGVLLDMNLGDTWDAATLEKLASAQFPRLSDAEIKAMVADAVKTRSLQEQLNQAQAETAALKQAIASPPLRESKQIQSDRQFSAGGAQSSPDA